MTKEVKEQKWLKISTIMSIRTQINNATTNIRNSDIHQINSAVEALLNSYDDLCILYLNKQFTDEEFKQHYKNEIMHLTKQEEVNNKIFKSGDYSALAEVITKFKATEV